MFVYNIKSRNRIFHYDTCHYVLNKEKSRLRYFYTIAEARSAGFKPCLHCYMTLKHLYKKEERKLYSYAAHQGLSIELCNNYISIETPYSKWRVVLASKSRRLQLYHKNSISHRFDVHSSIPGYHLQKAKSSTILGFMKYIFRHETFRRNNPVVVPVKAASSPKKGTKRARKEMKEKKRRERYYKTQMVLSLMDALHCNK